MLLKDSQCLFLQKLTTKQNNGYHINHKCSHIKLKRLPKNRPCRSYDFLSNVRGKVTFYISANRCDFYFANLDHPVTKPSLGWKDISRAGQRCFTTMIGGLAALILLTTMCKCNSKLVWERQDYVAIFAVAKIITFHVVTVTVCLFSADLVQTSELPDQISLRVAELGGNVTLKCSVSETRDGYFYWYKQSLGFMVQTVFSAVYSTRTISPQFHNQRFNVTKGDAQYFLTIRNISKEDEATYFCQNGATYSRDFVNGIFLAVNGKISPTLEIITQIT